MFSSYFKKWKREMHRKKLIIMILVLFCPPPHTQTLIPKRPTAFQSLFSRRTIFFLIGLRPRSHRSIRYTLFAIHYTFCSPPQTRFRYFHATSLEMSSVAESKSYSVKRIPYSVHICTSMWTRLHGYIRRIRSIMPCTWFVFDWLRTKLNWFDWIDMTS